MQIKVINPIEYPYWDQHVSGLNDATVFHTAGWAKVLSETYKYRPLYVSAFEDGRLIGCLPLMDVRSFLTGCRGVSLPFTDECCPLYESTEQFNAIWEHALWYGKKIQWKHIELRGQHIATRSVPEYCRYFSHTINLSGKVDSIRDQFRNSMKRNINKALKSGVEISRSYSMESLKAFYRLNCLTRKKHGLPPQPAEFFEKICEHIISTKMGFVLLAVYTNSIIAAAVFFKFRDKMFYKYGASNHSYLRVRPNNLIFWEAIKIAINSGCNQLDLGRTETANAGLRYFKSGWNASEDVLKYFRYDLKTNSFCGPALPPRSSYSVFKKMPLPVLRLSGDFLYKHLG